MESIRQYQIQKQIAVGGMGRVYLAYDPIIKRKVVIKKAIHRKNPVIIKRFLREAKAISSLNHPNIAKVYDAFHENQEPYIVMQYIEGRALNECVEFSFQEVAQVFWKISQALEYAHSNNIIHRDLKPDNILVDNEGVPFLIDFGLAKTQKVDKKLTKTGQILGTPNYMSPEQAEGEQVDQRSDIYSLGVTLYEILTKKRLVTSLNIIECIKEVKTRPHQPLRKINPKIPSYLEAICMKALEKKLSQRYQKMHEVESDLNSFLHNQKIVIPRKRFFSSFPSKSLYRVPVIIAVISILYLSFRMITAPDLQMTTKYYKSLNDSSHMVEVLQKKALFYQSKKLYTKAQNDFDAAIRKQPYNARSYYLRGRLLYQLKKYNEAEKDFDKSLGLDPRNITVYLYRGDLYKETQRWDKAQADYEKAAKLSPTGTASYRLGLLYHYHIKNFPKAEGHYLKVLKVDPENFLTHFHLGILYKKEFKELETAQKYFLKCLSLQPNHGESYWELGNCYYVEKNYKEAELHYSKALKIKPHSLWFTIRGNLRYVRLNKPKQAKEDYKQALLLDPKNGQAVLRLADWYSHHKQYAKAEELHNRHVEIVPGSRSYFVRGNFYHHIKNLSKALDDYDRAVQENSEEPDFFFYRAMLLREMFQFKKALKDINVALSLDPNKANYHLERSQINARLGLYREALQDIEIALQKQPRNLNFLFQKVALCTQVGLHKETEQGLIEIIKIRPDYQNYSNLAGFYRERKQFSKSLSILDKAQQKKFDVLYEKSVTLLRAKRFRELETLLQQRLLQSPNDHTAHHVRGLYAETIKQYDLAEQSYSKAIAIKPKYQYLAQRAKVYIYHKIDYDKALADINQALEIDVSSACLQLRILILENKKLYQQALQDCDELLKIHPDLDKVHIRKAEIFLSMKRYQESEKEYTKAIELAPQQNSYYLKRASLYKKWGKIQKAIADIKAFNNYSKKN